MKTGDIVSKNFQIDEPIKSIADFVFVLRNADSFFWKFKVMPTAFFWSWGLRQILSGIERGEFWTVQKITNSKK